MPYRPAPVVVRATRGSKLEQLHERYLDAKRREETAKAEADALKVAVEVELTLAAPGQSKVDLHGPGGSVLRMQAKGRTFVDGKRLNAELPDVYEAYTKTTTYWELREVNA